MQTKIRPEAKSFLYGTLMAAIGVNNLLGKVCGHTVSKREMNCQIFKKHSKGSPKVQLLPQAYVGNLQMKTMTSEID